MQDWCRLARLGFWERIDLLQLFDSEETAQLLQEDARELLDILAVVLPVRTVESGFEARQVRASEKQELAEHVRSGRYAAAMVGVKSTLSDFGAFTAEEVHSIEREAERLAQKSWSHAPEKLASLSKSEKFTLWYIRQLEHASFLEQQILGNLEFEKEEPSDNFLLDAEALAREVLEAKGLSYDTGNMLIVMYRLPQKSNSVTDYEAGTWEQVGSEAENSPIENCTPLDDDKFLGDGTRDSEPLCSITQLQPAAARDLPAGAFPLSDLRDPSHELFETSVGQAVAILGWIEVTENMVSLVNAPGPYQPGKKTITSHMHEYGRATFEIGRHVERLQNCGFVYHAKASKSRQKQIDDIANEQRDKMKDGSRPRLIKMLELRNNGHNKSSSARITHEKYGLGPSTDANRELYKTWIDEGKISDFEQAISDLRNGVEVLFLKKTLK